MVLHEIVLGRDRFDEHLAHARSSGSLPLRMLAVIPATLGVRGIRRVLGRLLIRIERSNLALAREMEFNAELHVRRKAHEALDEFRRGEFRETEPEDCGGIHVYPAHIYPFWTH